MHEYKITEQGQSLQQAKKALIMLHGRGADARDILSLAKYFADENTYIAAPDATNYSWYPYSFMAPEKQNEPWLWSAVETVKKLIDSITKVLPSEKLYIMGFSQGACLSLETTARYAACYGGVAAFTGGLTGETINPLKYSGNYNGTPVFIGNSDHDPHVPEQRTAESASLLAEMGAIVTYRVYPNMPHTINQDEIETVRELFHLP